MLEGYNEFKNLYENNDIKMFDQRFDHFIQDFTFLEIKNENEFDIPLQQKILQSKIITKDVYPKDSYIYSITCFDDYLIFFSKTLENVFNAVLLKNEKKKVFIIPNGEEKSEEDKFQFNQFKEEITNFTNKFQIGSKYSDSIKNFWKIINPCLSGYLIKKSYMNCYNNRFNVFINEIEKTKEIKVYDENEFIQLRRIDMTATSQIDLSYHIETRKLIAIKKIFKQNEKLEKREINNYVNLYYPLVPKYYGTIKEENFDFLVIEYINGHTLKDIKKIKLSEKQKIVIIIYILCIIQYLHNKNYIYRDLKPNNVIIDSNYHAILIDFDKLIQKNVNNSNFILNQSFDINRYFSAPELDDVNYIPSEKCDIYSIGLMIYFILMEKEPKFDNHKTDLAKFKEKYQSIYEIYLTCTKSEPNERPKITEIIDFFFNYYSDNMKKADDPYTDENEMFFSILNYINEYHNFISIHSNKQDANTLFFIGKMIYNGLYDQGNINKAIEYFLKAAEKNHPRAQNMLGIIYLDMGKYDKAIEYFSIAAYNNDPNAQHIIGMFYVKGLYIKQDIQKGMYYVFKAAEQRQVDALIQLGVFYHKGEYVTSDINKAIRYFKLASDQDNDAAQLFLGMIYFDGTRIKRDLNKSIHYLKLSAKHNNSFAVKILGKIYNELPIIQNNISTLMNISRSKDPYKNNFLNSIKNDETSYKFDINQSIYYLTISANNNDSSAQLKLGKIFYEGKQIQRDINKAIYYFSLAAKQNNSSAQNFLGEIYYEGIYVPRDINRSIFYFSRAADQNNHNSQYSLGLIYYEGNFVNQDINKAIYYFTLSANQNNELALFYLGHIYINGDHIKQDISKAIHYLTLSSSQNFLPSHTLLGIIYFLNQYVQQDINKAIYYLSLAANQNESFAQYLLGCIYLKYEFDDRNIKRALTYLELSAKNGYSDAQLIVADLYLEGKLVNRDINKAISLYKEVSCFGDPHAKNNLGVIYKNGFNEVKTNIYYAKELFNEAIRMKNDAVSMYNLANILFMEEEELGKNHDESLKLLIKSSDGFDQSSIFICLILMKKYNFLNLEIIEREISKYKIDAPKLCNEIYEAYSNLHLLKEEDFNNFTNYYLKLEFLYIDDSTISSIDLIEEEKSKAIQKQKLKPIDNNFIQGFWN